MRHVSLSVGGMLFAVVCTAVVRAEGPSSFQRGHIFVAVSESESCDFGGREWIVEIDPDTGDWSVFADSDDGICDISGLRFTPDGSRLLVANGGHILKSFDGGWIQAFNPDGTSEVILDETDGLAKPVGANALAFDAAGDLFVLSGETAYILRFPAGGGPATIFADWTDGVDIRGALDFAPSGDLYYARWSGAVLRFTPDGEPSMFDDIGTRSMAVDRFGNMYTSAGSNVNRFECEDPSTKHVFASGFFNIGGSVAPSLDASRVYYAQAPRTVYTLDSNTGAASVLADLSSLSPLGVTPYGMTVYGPTVHADVDGDGDVDLGDVAHMVNCWSIDPQPPRCDCRPADVNADGQISIPDHVELILNLNGPGK